MVRALREARGLSQRQLADAAGVSLRTIRYLESRGVRNALVGTVERVAKALGTTVARLLEDEGM